ncbi:MAG: hypothetical protein ACYCW6_13615 [Candidatus Xenobia bacterium]
MIHGVSRAPALRPLPGQPPAAGPPPAGDSVQLSSVTTGRTGGFVPIERNGWIQTQTPSISVKVGPMPTFTPELVLSEDPVAEITRRYAGPDTLIVTDAHNYDALKHLGACVQIDHGTPEQVHDIVSRPEFSKYKRIVGVGGCLALDMARAAAVDGQDLVLLPTLLSTNCITKNRTVLGENIDEFSYRSGTPRQVVIPVGDILRQPADVRARWSQSGYGDFFAKLSAMIDQLTAAGKPATLVNMRGIDAEVVDGLDWVNHSFTGYNRDGIEHLAHYAHDAGVKVVHAANNDISIGGEHTLYKAVLDLYPDLRQVATHGQIVAIGTLIAARELSESTGDAELYDSLHHAFQKLGIPTRWKELNAIGLTRDVLEKTLGRIAQPDVKPSYLSSYFKTHDFSILDRIFS